MAAVGERPSDGPISGANGLNMHYLLEPLDVALFRDGRPFGPEEFLRARLISPVPMPRTIYGAFRGLILQHKEILYDDFKGGRNLDRELTRLVGTPARLGDLRIRGPFLAAASEDGGRLLLPCPADFVLIGYPDPETGLQRPAPEAALGNYPADLRPLIPYRYHTSTCRWVACRPEEPVSYELEHAILDSAGLREYLTGEGVRSKPVAEYVYSEPHVGIERSTETLRPETGKIYSVDFARLVYRKQAEGGTRAESAAYVVEVLAPEDCLPEDTVFPVGGERRPFRIRRVPWSAWFGEPLRQQVAESLKRSCADGVCRFRLYLLTPACFDGLEAWRPDLSALAGGLDLTLVAAAVPRAIPYSGWDMVMRRPREGRRLAPAGSVYFVEAKANRDLAASELIEQLMKTFWLESVCVDEDFRKMGFGLTLIGGWSYAV